MKATFLVSYILSDSFHFCIKGCFFFLFFVLFSLIFSCVGRGFELLFSHVRIRISWFLLPRGRVGYMCFRIFNFLCNVFMRLVILYHELCHFIVSVLLALSVVGFFVGSGGGYVRVRVGRGLTHAGVRLFFSGLAPVLISCGILFVLYLFGYWFYLGLLVFPLGVASSLSKEDLSVIIRYFPHSTLFCVVVLFLFKVVFDLILVVWYYLD